MGEMRRRVSIIDPEFLLKAYCSGYFPMADGKSGEIGWYSPDPRAIFELDALRVPRSLSLAMKKEPFELLVNNQFEEVMRACAARKETWISEEIIQSYIELHRLGYAHSVECWKDQKLVGGLYGVAIRGAFFGESMFSLAPDSSKVALAGLVERLKAWKFELIDCQVGTGHLQRLGAREITGAEFSTRLAQAMAKPSRQGKWSNS